MAQNLEFSGNMDFFQEVEDARQEIFEIYCQEGGNNGEPVLNPDAVSDEELKMWCEINAEWLAEIELDLEA